MDSTIIWVVAALGGLYALLLVLSKRQGSRGKGAESSADARPMSMAEVEELARQGQKIAAIKAYREIYGTSLHEAKEAVERIIATQGASQGRSPD